MLYFFKVQSVVILLVNSEPLFQNSIMDSNYSDYDNIDIANQPTGCRERIKQETEVYLQ